MRPPEGWRLDRTLQPALPEIDVVCADVRNRLKGSAAAADFFAVELLLREALVNAIRHGCRGRPGGQVRCRVRRRGWALRVSVTDDGPGFDWRARQSAPLPELEASGRGVALYAVYADRVAFNETGNEVVLYRRLHAPAEEIER